MSKPTYPLGWRLQRDAWRKEIKRLEDLLNSTDDPSDYEAFEKATLPAAAEAPGVAPWRVAKNRHPNFDGTDWGWIEGASGIFWSDERGSKLTKAQAGQMVADHNAALAAQPKADSTEDKSDSESNAYMRDRPADSTAAAAEGVEAAIQGLVTALAESKGWMRGYADATIRDAIDRRTDAKGAAPAFLQEADQHLLHRFIETIEDGEGYDIGKEAVKRLADLGVVQSAGFGRYGVTMFGYWVHEHFWHQNPSLPLMTNADRDAAAASKAAEGGA